MNDGVHSWSPDEFADRHDVGRTTVFKEIKNGRLPARKIGQRTIITAEDEQVWLSRLPKVGDGITA